MTLNGILLLPKQKTNLDPQILSSERETPHMERAPLGTPL